MLSVVLEASEWNLNTNTQQKFLSYVFQIIFCLLLQVNIGLENFLNVVVISLVVERAGRFIRLCPQVGVACSDCSCVLEVMLSKCWVMWDGSMDVRYDTHNICVHIHTYKYRISSSSTYGYY